MNPKKLQFVAAIRPRNRTAKNICFSCQEDFTKNQTSVSKAPYDEGGPWDLAEAEQRAQAAAEEASILEGEAAGLASEFGEEDDE
ncbi:hypothetical protein [Streptomyces sp. CBMA29]|uniref:hypothetical protein n=1 Tax=Streptomyces sp. CBMA29 TaxID=1896314 RepID=UPI001661BB2B|nr:hypothetical protein [Streptomyces sp. CBMA29]